MIFGFSRAAKAARARIDHLYGATIAAARAPALYQECGAHDDLDGRFEMVTLHAQLLLRRLSALAADDIAKALVERLFESFDDALREMSVGDAGVKRRMMAMAGAFYGRAEVYGAALAAGDAQALAEALARNALRSDAPAHRLAERVLAMSKALDETPLAALLAPDFRFPEPSR